MKYSQIFKNQINCKTEDEVFNYLISSLKESIKSWDYFVKWPKVMKNYHDAEVCLNLLNTLIGKEDIENEAIKLLTEYPKIIRIIPGLLAYRDKKLDLLSDIEKFTYENFDFSEDMDVLKAVRFMKSSGFLKVISDRSIKSIPDYFIGVETGLDSNGRKNRTGTSMETIIEIFVKDICVRNGYEYIAQATSDKIKEKWNKEITVKKAEKRIDFAINTPNKLFLIETNFYGVVGSKLKATAGEYIAAFNNWSSDGHQFIWVTDGFAWKNTQGPLRDTFNVIDYILNIDMVQNKILEKVINNE